MIDEESFRRKRVIDIIEVIEGNIVNLGESRRVDAIVNAAKPTLMGGSGVDGAIHERMDEILGGSSKFNNKIKEELKEDRYTPSDKIRCEPGNVVMTEGDRALARHIIHAVGPKYDGGSGCIQILQKCYENIMAEVFGHSDIKRVAIPIISSGNYGFPMELAFRIALTTIGNCLIKCKKQKYDQYAGIEKIYIVVYDERGSEKQTIMNIYNQNRSALDKELRMVPVSAVQSQRSYLREIWQFDSEKRYYFAITKMVRFVLALLRFFFPSMIIRNLAGKKGWKFRREAVEIETMLKALLPILCILLIQIIQVFDSFWIGDNMWFLYAGCVICAYTMADTVTCLLSLIFLADIQSPSANQLRTLILLGFNYLGMVFGIAMFYYTYYWGKIKFLQALDYSILGKDVMEAAVYTGARRAIDYTRSGIEFFFLVLTFTFFVAHLKQRRFLSDDKS